ncbi:hypothetical protein ANTQUA_LOCUS2708 [Anthophora quadrimaculata]
MLWHCVYTNRAFSTAISTFYSQIFSEIFPAYITNEESFRNKTRFITLSDMHPSAARWYNAMAELMVAVSRPDFCPTRCTRIFMKISFK